MIEYIKKRYIVMTYIMLKICVKIRFMKRKYMHSFGADQLFQLEINKCSKHHHSHVLRIFNESAYKSIRIGNVMMKLNISYQHYLNKCTFFVIL